MMKPSFGKVSDLKPLGNRRRSTASELSAADNARKQMSGSAMQAAMSATTVVSSKNYLKQNTQHIKETAKSFREKRSEAEAKAAVQPFKLDKFKAVKAQVDLSPPESWRPKNRGSPSGSAEDSTGSRLVDNNNFIKRNAENAAIPPTPSPATPPPSTSLHRIGEIPSYLQVSENDLCYSELVPSILWFCVLCSKTRQREQRESEEAEAAEERAPDGFKVLSVEEKERTLQCLRKKKAEAERDYKRLPLKIETLGQQRRLAEAEKRMDELDTAIEAVSKPRVLVELDSN
eukprot:GHVQ01037616.1.p1 GENE.GHVQ01037616.1~~GHVQ01037616.1.p1  ORF type:complete len:288 (+),score=45.62 GHVQ01037616.1:340-1203(+)